jgi:restriction endonuclease S subunit
LLISALLDETYMIIKLHEIAEIKTGITFRNRLLDNLEGEVEVIQMKDVDFDGNISENLVHISEDLVKPKHLLGAGQLILLAKGKYTSACLIKESDKKLVISSAFFSLKVKHGQKVLPEYLQWYLNQPEARNYFKSFASGTSMFTLPMSVLKNLPIPLPHLPVQEKVIRMVRLRDQEKNLVLQLEDEKEKYIQQLLLQHVYQN